MMFRVLSAICVTLAVAFEPAAAREFETNFLIKRNGKTIGYHRVEAAETGEGLSVRTDIAMKVKVGPIPVFHYSHAAEEFWREGALEKASSRTNRNGRRSYFRAMRDDDGLAIESTAYKGPLLAGAHTTSWWNREVLEARRLASTQTGEVIEVDVQNMGISPAPGGAGAEHFRIVGGVEFDIWYDGADWVGARFVIDGEELIYEWVDSPAEFAELSRTVR